MPSTEQISASFPIARCNLCEREVLTYLVIEGAGEDRRCVHCDAAVGAELRWIDASQLEAEGYSFGAPSVSKGSGCGSGCGTCAVRK